MTPDQQRDKLDLVMSKRDVDKRIANIFEGAVNAVMARYCYTESEARAAARAYFGPKRSRSEAHQ